MVKNLLRLLCTSSIPSSPRGMINLKQAKGLSDLKLWFGLFCPSCSKLKKNDCPFTRPNSLASTFRYHFGHYTESKGGQEN